MLTINSKEIKMVKEKTEKEIKRENIKLLTTIIFSLLLVLAFLSNYYMDILGNFMRASLCLGIFSLFMLFLAYNFVGSKWDEITLFLSYLFSLSFMLFLFKMIIGSLEILLKALKEIWENHLTIGIILCVLIFFECLYLKHIKNRNKKK